MLVLWKNEQERNDWHKLMTDITSDPVKDADNHMKDLEVVDGKMDKAVINYLETYVDNINPISGKPEFYQDFDDCMVTVTEADKDKMRDYLRKGHFEMFRFYVGGIALEYMREIAIQAVRARNNLD